jgi:hypothetical protein
MVSEILPKVGEILVILKVSVGLVPGLVELSLQLQKKKEKITIDKVTIR